MCCRIGGGERETSACFDEFDEISWAFNKFIICLRHNLHHLINFFPSSSPIVICGIWFLRKYLQSTWSGSCESCEWDALDIWLCLFFFRLSPNDFPLSAAKIEKKLVNFNEQKKRKKESKMQNGKFPLRIKLLVDLLVLSYSPPSLTHKHHPLSWCCCLHPSRKSFQLKSIAWLFSKATKTETAEQIFA